MTDYPTRVGALRPSQIMFSYGVGAIVDLPHLSTIVLGLDDWPADPGLAHPIEEERLLHAVRRQLGPQVQKLLAPPVVDERRRPGRASDNPASIGVPVASFPRWMVCPKCEYLAPLSTGLFELRRGRFHLESARYVHVNCPRSGKPPAVVPARFLVACENGHLDDFPWIEFVHEGPTNCAAILRLTELGPTDEARDLVVKCDTCGKSRPLAQAFGEAGRARMPQCRGRRPHLRDYDDHECTEKARAILLGASNLWFADVLATLAIPAESGRLAQLVDDTWSVLKNAATREILAAFRAIGQLPAFVGYTDDEIWQALQHRQQRDAEALAEQTDLKQPEWEMLTNPNPTRNSDDFRVREVAVPTGFEDSLQRVVLVERLREVRALIGFTRIDAPGEFGEAPEDVGDRRMAISRRPPAWIPAAEVRGEGIFIQFREDAVRRWDAQSPVHARQGQFRQAHRAWRAARGIEPPEGAFPGMRYVLLHSFAHALMRQVVLECGYTAASVRERIYSRNWEPASDATPMAGVLIYTAAPDSEGTLGGLVSLGEPEQLGRLLTAALGDAQLCASDPLCAEHAPEIEQGISLHGAACHACMLAPETSCERGNKFLDRSVLAPTFERTDLAYFPSQE